MKSILQKLMLFLLPLICTSILQAQPEAFTPYENEINSWHKERIARLTSATGWLNLEGLYWLKEGRNSFGSNAGNDLQVENESMPGLVGYFERNGPIVNWHTQPGVTVLSNGNPVTKALIFPPEAGSAPLLATGPFRWNIINRDDQIGVRFRNLDHKAVQTFAGIDRFAIDTAWRLTARLIVASDKNVFMKNVLGQTISIETPGKLAFTVAGKTYFLDAIDEGEDELFIIFGDATSGLETYPAGRYMYVQKPGADGFTIIDFNKSYNPPCAFTEYATCLLPAPQNILPFEIRAGEKKYEK